MKRILLLCASLDLLVSLLGACILISEFSQDIAGFCWDACIPALSSQPSALLPGAIFLCGWALFPLIACIAGCLHALMTRRGKWLAFGLGPAGLLECFLLLWLTLVFLPADRPHLPLAVSGGFLAALYFLAPFLGSLLCLVYSFRVEE